LRQQKKERHDKQRWNQIISQILKAAIRVSVGDDGYSGVTQTKTMHKHFLAMSKLYFKGMLLLPEYATFKN
jgi:hypothetical protein